MSILSSIFGGARGRSVIGDLAGGFSGYQQGKTLAHQQSEERRRQAAADAEKIRVQALQDALIGAQTKAALALATQRQTPPVLKTPDPVSWRTIETDGGFIQENPVTGETRPLTAPGGQEPVRGKKPAAPRGPDPYGGRTREQWLADERARQQITADLRPPPKAPAGPKAPASTESMKKAAFLLPGAETALASLETYKPSIQDAIARRIPGVGGMMESEESQKAGQAAATIAEAYIRLTTGASATTSELANVVDQMVPKATDKPGTLIAKAARRKQVVQAIRDAAGNAAHTAAATPPPPSGPRRPLDGAGRKADPVASKYGIE